MPGKNKLSRRQAVIADDYVERTKNVPGLLKFAVSADGNLDLENSSVEAAAFWMELLGLTHGEELAALITQIAKTAPNNEAIAAIVNRTLASIAAMKPRDTTETMLCAQMVAVHNATMRTASYNPMTFEGSGQQANSLAKLAKTYVAQMEGLTRYRSRGQQRVVVEHLHVHDGGQVAVGTFGHQGGGVASNYEEQPHVRIEQAQLPERQTMLGEVETVGLALQGSSGEGVERLPISRG